MRSIKGRNLHLFNSIAQLFAACKAKEGRVYIEWWGGRKGGFNGLLFEVEKGEPPHLVAFECEGKGGNEIAVLVT